MLAQIAFQQDLILPVSYPLVALAIGTLGALLVSYLAETWERELSDRYGAVLEDTVRERTAELLETQVEVIRRLAQAAELRDDDTGAHIDRVGGSASASPASWAWPRARPSGCASPAPCTTSARSAWPTACCSSAVNSTAPSGTR